MSLLPILRWPDPRLAQPCAEVAGDVAGQAGLIRDMFETMYAAPGRGLAAPQVGVMLRLFVMDAGWKSGAKTPRVCINPHILSMSEDICAMDEGCLSLPGVTAGVTRPAEIVLGYTDERGIAQRVDLDGAEARIAQHELDHLNGVMHFDRLESGGRAALLAEYEALA